MTVGKGKRPATQKRDFMQVGIKDVDEIGIRLDNCELV